MLASELMRPMEGSDAPVARRLGSRNCFAFTLVEMLVVMAIIVVLLALVVPATVTLMRGSQLSQAGSLLASQLELARQTALARNRSVQVRLCKPTGTNYSALMLLVSTPATNSNGTPIQNANGTQQMNYTAAGKPVSLPTSIIIDAGPTLSSILNPVGGTPTTAGTSDPRLGGVGTGYQYVSFQFRPDGSTDLLAQTSPSTSTAGSSTTSLWFLTVHNVTNGDSLQTPPFDYFTIQVDAYNGQIRQYRP